MRIRVTVARRASATLTAAQREHAAGCPWCFRETDARNVAACVAAQARRLPARAIEIDPSSIPY